MDSHVALPSIFGGWGGNRGGNCTLAQFNWVVFTVASVVLSLLWRRRTHDLQEFTDPQLTLHGGFSQLIPPQQSSEFASFGFTMTRLLFLSQITRPPLMSPFGNFVLTAVSLVWVPSFFSWRLSGV